MQRETISKAVKGTWVLTIASLFSELLSAIYRIPLQNIVGDRGYFIYQQVYPIYGIFSVLALTGLPVVLSKSFAQQNDQAAKNKLLKISFVIMMAAAIGLIFVIWSSARYLAIFMGDPSLYHEIRTVSLAFILVPFEASLRGYFQSDLVMEPSAFSQVLEQLIRIIIIIGSAVLFGRGAINIYQMGALANSGAFIGGIFAVFILLFTFLKSENKFFIKTPEVNIELEHGLGLEIVLITLFTGITIFYQFIDSFSMLRLLMHNGMPLHQAEIMKGVFDRAQPLIQLGIVISLSFISTIMPQLKKTNQTDQNKPLIKRMVRVCLLLSIAETAGLVALMPDINMMLFTNTSGSVALAIYMCSIFLVSTINLLVAVTSGDSSKNLSKLVLFIASLVFKIVLNILLVPSMHITGSAIATVLSECVILFGIMFIYRSSLGFLVLSWDYVLKTAVAGLVMALMIRALEKFMLNFMELTRLSSVLINVILIPIGVVIFLFFAVEWKLLKKSEWEILPFGKHLVKLIKIED
ncbi:putative polysaccharide biosynthesis protein [Companilactobacillus mishanensis]|uniref:putative polysaccharide biosynthesis protein n=1 Tax=Companilactobacillus mishanensis TaxID=2486008 RepID=UPI0012962940|nr:polysaccharide biosynthesis protein [Companilactobacillus mishanensis]MQS89450.1 polysaccharide biosynthesis protein [Companilactobacillus mishanensis]